MTYDAAANVTGQAELAAKTLVIQATNVTQGVGEALFELAVPGAGNGPFSQQACVEQYSAPPAGYGRCKTKSDCEKLPAVLQAACRFRFDWINDLHTPKRDVAGLASAASGNLGVKVDYERVRCPSELVAKSKYVLPDDNNYPAPPTYNDTQSGEIATLLNQIVPQATAAPAQHAASTDDKSSSGNEKRDGPPQEEFAQCGGQGYAGVTECDTGLSCFVQSAYYSYVSSHRMFFQELTTCINTGNACVTFRSFMVNVVSDQRSQSFFVSF